MGNMRFKVGDRVRIKSLDWYNENKSKSHGTVACGSKYFDYDMREWCGKTMTILDAYQTCYIMKEDGAKDLWTDEMIEGLVKDETKSEDGLLDDYEELTDRAFKGGYEKCKSDIELNGFQLPEGYQFVDENGNEIFTSKIILKKKQKYPKTYEECAEVLGECAIMTHGYKRDVLNALQKLIVCRDAYWKLAGEEMGLGKPWEPDWSDYENIKYIVGGYDGEIGKDQNHHIHKILAFPTEEMRDAFYEAFREEIEICKELL